MVLHQPLENLNNLFKTEEITDPLEQFALSSITPSTLFVGLFIYIILSLFSIMFFLCTVYLLPILHSIKQANTEIQTYLNDFWVIYMGFFGKMLKYSMLDWFIRIIFLADSSLSYSTLLLFNSLSAVIRNLAYINIYIYYLFISILIVVINKSINPYRFFSVKYKVFNKAIKTVFSVVDNTLNSSLNQISFIWFWYLFIALLYSNLLGLVPASFTPSASLVMAVYTAATYFLALHIFTVILHKELFAALFLPPNTPFLILPFMFAIEVISFYARVASLSIRCFANLMSGHTLMHIIIGVVWKIFRLTFPLDLTLLIAFVGVAIIFNLEFSIGIMQAIIFLVLLGIYFESMIVLH